jgi:hypothetical protein
MTRDDEDGPDDANGIVWALGMFIFLIHPLFFTNEILAGLLGILEEKSIHRGIIVFPGNMTPSARKVCHHSKPPTHSLI